MKIQIKKLGIINSGIIDLNSPLTVFCGPNGTGKTYLSYIIYALISDLLSPIHPLSNEEMEELAEQGCVNISISELNAISYRKSTIELLKSRLDEIFGLSKKESSKILKDFDLCFLSSDEEYIKSIRTMSITLNIDIRGSIYKVNKKQGKMQFRLSRDKRKNIDIGALQIARYLISSLLYQRFMTHGIRQAYMFTVERSSIFTFNKELMLSRSQLIDLAQDNLASSFITRTNFTNLLESNSNRYPLAIRKNIQFAADIEQIKKKEGAFADFSDYIEQKLLNGNHVDIDSDGKVFLQIKKNITLPIHMAASVAKTLAPLILTLRHKTDVGDLLIIDEPELNLHPAAQILFARVIAQMINKGLRILISTHSDYIISELNNMIMWGGVYEKQTTSFNDLGYSTTETLKPGQVSVYVFNFTPSSQEGVTIESVPVKKTGFEIKAIDAAILQLNESGEDAYTSIIQQDKKI